MFVYELCGCGSSQSLTYIDYNKENNKEELKKFSRKRKANYMSNGKVWIIHLIVEFIKNTFK